MFGKILYESFVNVFQCAFMFLSHLVWGWDVGFDCINSWSLPFYWLSIWLPIRLSVIPCQKRFWTLRRHGTHFADVEGAVHIRIWRMKICSVMLLPTLNPACSAVIISAAWDLRLFKMTYSLTKLGWMVGVIVLNSWLSCRLPVSGSICLIIHDWALGVSFYSSSYYRSY